MNSAKQWFKKKKKNWKKDVSESQTRGFFFPSRLKRFSWVGDEWGVCRAMLVVLLTADTNLSSTAWNTKWLNTDYASFKRFWSTRKLCVRCGNCAPRVGVRMRFLDKREMERECPFCLAYLFIYLFFWSLSMQSSAPAEIISTTALAAKSLVRALGSDLQSRGKVGRILALIYCCRSSPSCLSGRVLWSNDTSPCQ